MADTTLPIRYISNDSVGEIGVITLHQGDRPVVVLDESLIDELDRALGELRPGLGGFIIESSAPRSFVAGADLRSIMGMNDLDLHAYLERAAAVFQRIADMPWPTAALIDGAALGGGLELAMHCDALIGLDDPQAKPYPVGLPEAGLKICPGWGGTNLLPARMDPGEAIIDTARGTVMKSGDAIDRSLFDATAPSREGLAGAAIEWMTSVRQQKLPGTPSRWIGDDKHKADAMGGLDRARRELDPTDEGDAVLDCVAVGLSEGWAAALQCERDRLVALRHTPAATAAIGAFFAKAASK